MRLADRYVFAELILPFFIGTLAVLLMLVGTTLYEILPGMLQQHIPANVVFHICLLAIPEVLVKAIPVSTALAASLATNRMARDNEFTVIRAAGTPLLRAFVPMFVFGLIMSGITFYIDNNIRPWAHGEQQHISQYVINNLGTNPVDIGRTFTQGEYTISFATAQKISEDTRRLNKVIIIDAPKPNTPDYAQITTAETADYANGLWTLKNTVFHHFTPDGMTDLDAVSPTGTFRQQVDFTNIYQPLQMNEEANLSADDLRHRKATALAMGNFTEARTLEVARQFKYSLSFMCLALAICCPPLGLRFARTGTFTGVLLSIITVFVGWNTLLLLQIIANGGYLPPMVAAWTTDIVFAGAGIWLFRSQE